MAFFTEVEQTILKISYEATKAILRKNKAGDTMLRGFKLYYNALEIFFGF